MRAEKPVGMFAGWRNEDGTREHDIREARRLVFLAIIQGQDLGLLRRYWKPIMAEEVKKFAPLFESSVGTKNLNPERNIMRKLTDHIVNPANNRIEILVMDEPGHGGACHEYQVDIDGGESGARRLWFNFQNGPITEAGVNGLTHEVLLAILADRLRGFQSGSYACRENGIALVKIEEAQLWLQKRTRDRMARGVEGTHEV